MSVEASPLQRRTQYSVHFHKTKVRNLVDPASGRMLVSKIKPCKSKFSSVWCETANGSLSRLQCTGLFQIFTWITVIILELIHARP